MALDLLIVTFPNDEFQLAAPLLFSGKTSTLEVLHAFDKPAHGQDLNLTNEMWEDLIDRLKQMDLHRFRRVIVPSIHSEAPSSILCAAVSTIGLGNLWMLSESRHDEVVQIPTSGVAALMDCYNDSIQKTGVACRFGPQAFKTVIGLRKVKSCDVTNYAAFLGLPGCPRFDWLYAVINPKVDPWGLDQSAYEVRRHNVEFELLDSVDWSSLVEVGACTGVFTRRLVENYRGRRIVAVENDNLFLPRLRDLGGASLEVFGGSIFEYDVPADIFVMASCVYDMSEFPTHIFQLAQTAILTSHRADFEREIVGPTCASFGWRLGAWREVPPAVEIYCGEPMIRDGSLVNLWVR